MRIGLNSGPVIVGSIGDDLAHGLYGHWRHHQSGLQELRAWPDPAQALYPAYTHKLTRDFFEFESLGKVGGERKKQEHRRLLNSLKPGKVESRIEASVAKGLTRFVGRKNSMAALMEAY